MKNITTPRDLLHDQIRDLFDVENKVARTMPELAAQSPNSFLRDFLALQEEISLKQGDRLRQTASSLGVDLEGDECLAMKGLIEGGDKHISQAGGEMVKVLILVAHVLRIIHYQIAGYGFAAALAKSLHLSESHVFLAASLQEEREAAEVLAAWAMDVFAEVERTP